MNTVAGKISLPKFKNWLTSRGCEILPLTNEYETLRFRGKKTGVIYNTGKVSGKYTMEAIRAYKSNRSWDGRPVNTGRHSNYKKEKEKLLARDGTECFYCNKEMGEDITLEHLQALSKGGKNSMENSVLMHEKCNNELSNLGLVDKIKLIIEKRNNHGK